MNTAALDETHDPALRSWVESANDPAGDFPIQNLPFGRFRCADGEPWRIGVAIGDQVLDLHATGLVHHADMNRLMAAGPQARRELRAALSRGLSCGSTLRARWRDALVAQSQVQLGVPCEIGDYTDFYAGLHHATTVGRLFRPDQPLMPNYKWVPVGYHGRASSIVASGTDVHRPRGQVKAAQADAPVLQPSGRLDYELEVAVYIGAGNALGEPIPVGTAEDHVFGLGLLNDWSARDIQAWEYQPLGPFLAKNFASTISPWVVTLEALAPYRVPFTRPAEDPQPLPYLDSEANRAGGAFDIQLQVGLQTAQMRQAGQTDASISRTSYRHAYWTLAQMVTHHTVNGCNLQPGDLLGTGTLSGPTLDQAGALIELTLGGKQPVQLPNGETRTFLQDGDAVVLRGWCEKPGAARVGFGECWGSVLPAK